MEKQLQILKRNLYQKHLPRINLWKPEETNKMQDTKLTEIAAAADDTRNYKHMEEVERKIVNKANLNDKCYEFHFDDI